MQNCSHGDAFSEMLRAEVDEALASVSKSIVNQRGPRCGVAEWRKAIPESRDRLQSKVLVWCVVPLLAVPCSIGAVLSIHPHNSGFYTLRDIVVSLTFACIVWALRAATPGAAICGGMICFTIVLDTWHGGFPQTRSGITPLAALFLITFTATRAGRQRKRQLGLAEGKRGRNAGQIVANLGTAGLLAGASSLGVLDWFCCEQGVVRLSMIAVPTGLLAAFCEATADTVSSEVGQAFGGQPILLTTLRRVPTGTDGAITLLGTAAGILASGLVAATGLWAMRMTWRDALIAMLGGIFGLFFDSVLGATVERRGWLGNDLVNFSSTVFAVVVALALVIIF